MRLLRVAALLALASPAFANREGWANARQKAERMERRGEMAEAAAWWEAAAESLESGSAPLSALAVEEAKEDGDEGALAWWTKYAEEDARLAKEARERAKACAAKAGAVPEDVRASVRQFLDGWIVQDAENYWKWARVELRMRAKIQASDERAAAELESAGRRRWAGRYERICVPYWERRGDTERAREYAARAKEQRKLSEIAAKRAAECGHGDAEARRLLPAGTPEEQRTGARLFAARRDAAGLRASLEGPDAQARDIAAKALFEMNDPFALAVFADTDAGKALAAQRKEVEASPRPEDFLARLRGLSSDQAGVRPGCAESLARMLGPVPEGDPAALRAAFEKSLRNRLETGVQVEFRARGKSVAREAREDLGFDWRLEAPVRGCPEDGWALSARAFLDLPDDTVAELLVHCDDAVRVRIDGRAVIDEWTGAPEPLFRRTPLKLAKGLHSFELEYEDRSGVAVLRAWLAPGRDEVQPLGPLLRRLR